jgi:hypothetical protein
MKILAADYSHMLQCRSVTLYAQQLLAALPTADPMPAAGSRRIPELYAIIVALIVFYSHPLKRLMSS